MGSYALLTDQFKKQKKPRHENTEQMKGKYYAIFVVCIHKVGLPNHKEW